MGKIHKYFVYKFYIFQTRNSKYWNISKNIKKKIFLLEKTAGPVTFFATCLRMLISFLNDLDIQLILEFKKGFRK